MAINLLYDVPYINNRLELKTWLHPMYVISDYMENYEAYEMFVTKMYNIVKGCFVIHQCREYPIKFKFYRNDEKTYELELRHFVINLMLWRPFIELNELEILDESFILDCYNDIPELEEYINEKIINTLKEHHVRSTTINYACSEVLYYLRKISEDFSLILGLNFSAPMFIDLYENHPKIKELMECTFADNLQPHEIEQLLDQYEKEEIDYIKELPDNNLGVVLRANTGIKHKQLREFTISEGLKPTLEGITIPIPIQTSTLIKGIDKASSHYTDANGSRKSLVLNKKVMGKAGYFGKNVLMLARTLTVSRTVLDCGTKHYVKYVVKNKKFLKKLDGKYFKEKESDDLSVVNSKTMKDLIGKTIMVRSPATCACGNDEVCPRCIGRSSIMNDDIAEGYSAFESEEITEQLGDVKLLFIAGISCKVLTTNLCAQAA